MEENMYMEKARHQQEGQNSGQRGSKATKVFLFHTYPSHQRKALGFTFKIVQIA